jgi:hypothetical protein
MPGRAGHALAAASAGRTTPPSGGEPGIGPCPTNIAAAGRPAGHPADIRERTRA